MACRLQEMESTQAPSLQSPSSYVASKPMSIIIARPSMHGYILVVVIHQVIPISIYLHVYIYPTAHITMFQISDDAKQPVRLIPTKTAPSPPPPHPPPPPPPPPPPALSSLLNILAPKPCACLRNHNFLALSCQTANLLPLSSLCVVDMFLYYYSTLKSSVLPK
jgi:hypothetical protein